VVDVESRTPAARAAERQISAVVVRAVLGYVERTLGEAAVDAVVDASGVGASAAELTDPQRWATRDEIVALATAAAAACRDGDFGRRIGEQIVRNHIVEGVAAFIARSGTIAAAIPGLANSGTKMALSRRLDVVELEQGRAVIEARFADPADAHPIICGILPGYYPALPALFETSGAVVESTCQCRGDDACRYEITWDPEPSEATDASAIVGVEDLGLADVLIERFEQLQETASELAAAEDVPTVLARIMQRAAVAVQAPKYLLAVRTAPGEDLLIQQEGWADDVAREVALRMERGEVRPNELVVPVASAGRQYGLLAAVFVERTEVTAIERRLFAAYARPAASALEAAASLEAARRDRDTATALLELARALGEVTTQEEVVETLRDVVPRVVGADHSWIWLWDPEAERLDLAATSATTPSAAPSSLDGSLVPELRDATASPRPMVMYAADETEPPIIRRYLEAAGVVWASVVPVAARGDFLGFISAGFGRGSGVEHDADLVRRLQGIAGQAAAALDNARLLDHIRSQALRDPMTGLPNRPLIEDRANQALRVAARNGGQIGLLFVDLDRFKIVNDTLGHASGDRLICDVASRLAGCLRGSDTLARLGGDEFVVLLPSTSGVSEATAAAGRIVDALREPFDFDGRRLFISCSIGVAVSGHHGETYGELLQHADAAMYEAKAQGRNTYEIRAARTSRGTSQLDLEAQLHLAVDRDELALLYQPQIDFQTMRVVGVEALLRWDHPELGRLGPDAFLPLAEESGTIVELDRWVRETAIAQAAQWARSGHPIRMAVNVSTRDLRRAALCGEIVRLLDGASLPPELLELEITDRVVMSDEALPALLHDFHEIGVRLAIDDFGTGTSVLGRLQRCPVDVLKIDKGFVQTITPATPDAPVVTALLSLAKTLELEVVAEGVETAFQAGMLRRHGCDLAQGYFFSPPAPPEAVEALFAGVPGATPVPG
jgi:diguanylate cyclase (GGDEF)-like protein